MVIYIPLGCNCHPAYNLKLLGLRKYSLPFDWLLFPGIKGFEYINDLIKTEFSNFVEDLKYNKRKKVISQNYPYVEFFHQDLINPKNKSGQLENENNNLKETMIKRSQRFMSILENEELKFFIYCLPNKDYANDEINKFSGDLQKFIEILEERKVNFKLLIYVKNDNKDFSIEKLNSILIWTLQKKNIFIKKYIRDCKVSKIWGKLSDFKELIQKI